MQYAICVAKKSSFTWWTGKTWSTQIIEAKLFDNASQAKRKIQQIYERIDGIASVVTVNPDSPGIKPDIKPRNDQEILNSFSDRVKNLLCRNGFDSDEKVRQAPDWRLWDIRGLGEQSFYEIRSKLPYTSN